MQRPPQQAARLLCGLQAWAGGEVLALSEGPEAGVLCPQPRGGGRGAGMEAGVSL